MRPSDRSCRVLLSILAALALPLLSFAFGSRLHAQERASGGVETSVGFMPAATIVEVMASMVMPSAQVLWDAVSFESGPEGDVVKTPETDEEWEKLRWSAVTLAESANVLLIPGREVDKPGAPAAEGELAPARIEGLIDENHDAWLGHAHALHRIATEAIAAIDAKDGDQIVEVGGTLDAVCEGCHLQFWYPDQGSAG
jgi:hypothetical protein